MHAVYLQAHDEFITAIIYIIYIYLSYWGMFLRLAIHDSMYELYCTILKSAGQLTYMLCSAELDLKYCTKK